MREALIVGIGACVADTLYRVASFPREDTKLCAKERRIAGGGPAATGLVAAAKLGCSAAYIGNLADDESGRFLAADFEKYGVGTESIKFVSGCRTFSSCLILAEDSGTRTCVFDRGDLPPLELTEPQRELISRARLLMVDGNDLSAAIDGAKTARASGVKVLYDCGGQYSGVESLLALTDIMIPSEEFALAKTGCDNAEDAAEKLFETYRPDVVVITQGNRGGVFFDGECRRSYPAYPAKVVDSNGAGDVFHGAFAAAYVSGYGAEKCCHFASAASAIKCTGIGARESTPDLNTVKNFLKENGYEL